jgi:hypothetical protein
MSPPPGALFEDRSGDEMRVGQKRTPIRVCAETG